MASKNGSPENRKENGRVREWITQEDPVTIATHMRVDADAAFSAALLHILRPHANVVFVRADAIIIADDHIAVDLSEGPRSVKGLKVGSAFGLLVNVMRDIDRPVHDALRSWTAQLNLTDSGKRCHDKVTLAELVNCWRSLRLDDMQIVEKAEELLKGKIAAHKRHISHRQAADEVQIDRGVAIVKPGVHVKAVDLFRLGALAVVRESKIGQCVNLSREAMQKGLSLNELSGQLPDNWFIHPDGFLACYGSVKAPKNPRDSGMTMEGLTTIVQTWLANRVRAKGPAPPRATGKV